MFMPIAAIVWKLCIVKVENSVNARSVPFCQIWSHIGSTLHMTWAALPQDHKTKING